MTFPIFASYHLPIFSICLAQVISQLSHAIITAIPTSPPLLQSILTELTKWDSRPDYLRTAAHEWCFIIYKNYQKLSHGEELIFHCLEISFRGLNLEYMWPVTQLASTKHYQHVADIVSNCGSDETIADLLPAWIIHSNSNVSPKLLKLWGAHLIRLGHVASASQRLRQLAIHSIVFLGFHLGSGLFEPAGVEEFVALLDHLGIGIDDVSTNYDQHGLLVPLLEVILSPERWRSLSYPYWELIPELALSLAEDQVGPLDY